MKNKNVVLGIVAMATAFTSVTAMAQGSSGAGNGGRVWVCYEPKDAKSGKRTIKSVELVDYLEAGSISKWTIDLGVDHPAIDDTSAMIEVALKRLEKIDLWRATEVRERLNQMKTRSTILDLEKDRISLNRIADANILIAPAEGEDCVERQGAFNRPNPGPMDFKFAFIKQYLEKMSDRDRAGLYLHEAIYNVEAGLGATDSDGSREVVRAVSSPLLAGFSADAYYKLLKGVSKMPSVTTEEGGSYRSADVSGNSLVSGTLLFAHRYSSGVLCSAKGSAVDCLSRKQPLKEYALNIQAEAGESVGMASAPNRSGVNAGGRVITPGLSARTSDVFYLDQPNALRFKESTLNHVFIDWKNAAIEYPLEVSYPSLQYTNRISLHQNDDSRDLRVNRFVLRFKNDGRVSIGFKGPEESSLKTYITLDSEGYPARIEIAGQYKGHLLATMDEKNGNRTQQTLVTRSSLSNSDVRDYWVIDFDSSGNVTSQKLQRESREDRRE